MSDKIEIGKRIKIARDKTGITQEELASSVSMNKSTIQRYETGQVEKIKLPIIDALAEKLNVNVEWLACKTNEKTVYTRNSEGLNHVLLKFPNIEEIKTKKIPMLGKIACGTPIFAEEHHEMYVPVSEDIKADFCLRTQGDSMINAKINDGDIVFVKKQDLVENGEIAVVIVRDEATLKRVYYDKANNIIQLLSENPQYSPMVFAG